MNQIFKHSFVLAVFLTVISGSGAQADQPFQLGVEQRGQGQQTLMPVDSSGYRAPVATPVYQAPPSRPLHANANANANNNGMRLNAGAQQQPPQQRPVMQAGVQRVALPPAFMGSWLVQGQRTKVQAINAEFQANAEAGFAMTTRNVWNINGSPQGGYTMSNDQGVSTALQIQKMMGPNKAVVAYQHQMGKAMAQEMILMELQNGGASFTGIERITIVKEGTKRANVSYALSGQRQ